MNGRKYNDTIKVEFRDLIENLVGSSRTTFHLYTIHRILSLGLLVDFTFQYVRVSEPDKYTGIELDLKEHGKVLFIVDIESNYVHIANENYKTILRDFLSTFDTHLKRTTRKSRVF